ncbi:response regulator transcription factor [Synechocystis salina LEGE 06155]|nr:response regulator transcription factor [Synechocystis salina LEGE 06155]
MPNILIVEDDQEIAQLIRETLEREQFTCVVANDGETGLRIFQEQAPDLIVLDLMLPKLDGLEVCTRIRQQPGSKDPYILMLTAKGEEIDRIIGLSTGADDYLVKPFSPRELVARVRALLRRQLRQGQPVGQIYRTRHFQVDLDQHQAIRYQGDAEGPQGDRQEELELTGLEFNLLATFMSYPGRVWNRGQLIEKLWGNDFFGDERVVDTHIRRLRKKIEPDPANPSFVKTVIGLGYKFEDPG